MKNKIDDTENGDWGDLSPLEIEGIKAGIKDIKEGRFYSNKEIVKRINQKIKDLSSLKQKR